MARKHADSAGTGFAHLASLAVGAFAISVGLFWNGNVAAPAISGAEAVIGRPATPMSYAGVARRTTRRAAYAGAYAGAAYGAAYAPPPVAYAPRACVQVVDSYGRVTTRC
jgi:hypothetical protein